MSTAIQTGRTVSRIRQNVAASLACSAVKKSRPTNDNRTLIATST